ncbi:MAG: hypothetical protein JRI72_02225 [Deltaproteobacteria bacterium]|nr:hypothetical protein [Deltaproteobacteria bacterium]
MVTSDYVLWEFKGHIREELYARKLVNKHGFGLISANKLCRDGNFRKYANSKCMQEFGKKIEEYEKKIFDEEKLIYLERLIGRPFPGLSEAIDAILMCSKFPYKDAIVLCSAYFTKAHYILTCDEQHFNKDKFEELKKGLKEWQHLIHSDLDVKRPCMFPTIKSLRQEYESWFMTNNEKKIMGSVVKYYPRLKVIKVSCKKKRFLSVGDQIWLVKFKDGKIERLGFSIKANNLHSPRTEKPIQKGMQVCVKLPATKKNWDKAFVFLAE